MGKLFKRVVEQEKNIPQSWGVSTSGVEYLNDNNCECGAPFPCIGGLYGSIKRVVGFNMIPPVPSAMGAMAPHCIVIECKDCYKQYWYHSSSDTIKKVFYEKNKPVLNVSDDE